MTSQRSRLVALACIVACSALGAQPTAHPDSARLHTGAISAFWRAIDRAAGKDTAALVAALRTEYLANPSPGLFDWITNRLIDQSAVGAALRPTGWNRQRATQARTQASAVMLRRNVV